MTNTNKHKDQQAFRRTAATTKTINIKPRIMRGGIRM